MVSRASFGRELHEHDLDRSDLWPGRDDQWPEERIPRVEERKQRDCDKRGSHERKSDRPEKTQMPRAIDPRSVMELLGHREKELAQQEDREDAHEERNDLRRVRVVPPEVPPTHEHEVGDDRRLRGDEESRQEQGEEDASTAEAHASERVA